MPEPQLSIVIPAFRVAGCIGTCLRSIYSQEDRPLIEVIVVDDGSPDGEALRAVLATFPGVRLEVHQSNRGMCAGRNTGIAASSGRFVTILDADDELVPGWPRVFAGLVARWPEDHPACWAGCIGPTGRPTVSHPSYTGTMSLEDLLHERFSGEYLPLFRGPFIRGEGYTDIGTRKSCGIISYINFARKGPFWIDSAPVRIYHEHRPGSVTSGWHRPDKAAQSAQCLSELLIQHGGLYQRLAPTMLPGKHARLAVYRRLAGDIRGAWSAWFAGLKLPGGWRVLFAAPLVVLGSTGIWLVALAKRCGVLRAHG